MILVDFWVIQRVSSLDLGPLFAGAAFEKVLPSDFALGVEWGSERGFATVGIHVEVLVGKSALNALEQHESKIKLGVARGKCIAQCAMELCAAG